MSEIDCGDNSCRYAIKRGGMRTNGGCRCVENNPRGVEQILRTKLVEKDQRIKELEDALKFYADDSLGGGAWSFRKKFMFDLICESDLEYIGEPCGKKGQRYILGGKRARKALGSANAESEG